MSEYTGNDWREYLAHSWGKKPEQKKREKQYNHRYWMEHRKELLAKMKARYEKNKKGDNSSSDSSDKLKKLLASAGIKTDGKNMSDLIKKYNLSSAGSFSEWAAKLRRAFPTIKLNGKEATDVYQAVTRSMPTEETSSAPRAREKRVTEGTANVHRRATDENVGRVGSGSGTPSSSRRKAQSVAQEHRLEEAFKDVDEGKVVDLGIKKKKNTQSVAQEHRMEDAFKDVEKDKIVDLGLKKEEAEKAEEKEETTESKKSSSSGSSSSGSSGGSRGGGGGGSSSSKSKEDKEDEEKSSSGKSSGGSSKKSSGSSKSSKSKSEEASNEDDTNDELDANSSNTKSASASNKKVGMIGGKSTQVETKENAMDSIVDDLDDPSSKLRSANSHIFDKESVNSPYYDVEKFGEYMYEKGYDFTSEKERETAWKQFKKKVDKWADAQDEEIQKKYEENPDEWYESKDNVTKTSEEEALNDLYKRFEKMDAEDFNDRHQNGAYGNFLEFLQNMSELAYFYKDEAAAKKAWRKFRQKVRPSSKTEKETSESTKTSTSKEEETAKSSTTSTGLKYKTAT